SGALWALSLRTRKAHLNCACRFRQLSRLHRLQPDSPPARIAELRVRSGVSIYRRTPLRFHLESRWPSVGYFSNEHHAFASRNPIAKASRWVHEFRTRLGVDSAR